MVVVSRDLTQAHYATGIATRLQQVLDDWNFLSPQLQDLYDALNAGRARHAFGFEPERCMAPLPRAFQRLDAQAYGEHAALVAQAYGQTGEAAPGSAPRRAALVIRQGAGDNLAGPREAIVASRETMDIDFGAQLAVITADVRHGSTNEQALDSIRLLALANLPCLRAVWAAGDGLADVLAWPSAAFSPVAVTPDELGEAWKGGRAHLTLQVNWNGRKVGLLEAGVDMGHHFGQVIAQAVQTRHLRAGTVVCSGVVSNRGVEKKSRMDWPKGYASIADKRGMEVAQDGVAKTGFLVFGDTVRIEMKGRDGQSVFGAIEQEVVSWQAHAVRVRAGEAAEARRLAGVGESDAPRAVDDEGVEAD